jgi:hypothetical protein
MSAVAPPVTSIREAYSDLSRKLVLRAQWAAQASFSTLAEAQPRTNGRILQTRRPSRRPMPIVSLTGRGVTHG